MIIQSDYSPPAWLKNCHVQTVVGTWINRSLTIPVHRQRVELADDDFLEIDWIKHPTNDAQPTLLLLHGLEGSIESSYIQGLLTQYATTDWRVGVMHFRGCSGVPNRKLRSYHSGDTTDLHYVLHQLKHQGPLFVAGFSLGGNVLLKYLGEQGDDCIIDAAIAVSVPFDLDAAAKRLDKGLSKCYRWYLIRELKRKTRMKMAQFPDYEWISDEALAQIKSFVDFDHLLTAPVNGFASGKAYYDECSCGQFLAHIKKPTLVIHAEDDPFMTPDAIPTSESLSDWVTLELSDNGGHMGFLRHNGSGGLDRYLDDRIPDWFEDRAARLLANQ